mmetsp:Transcript_12795/g.36634  ORF Transcript_12795/g.36634 Transcript_12795/m.36634 type:complete len:502 (-) Transcript_12795:57-1562(-)
MFSNKSTKDVSHLKGASNSDFVDSTFASRAMSQPIPKSVMPDESIPSKVVYQVIKDLREIDSRPVLNLASFVTTYMEDEARQLMMDSLDVNFVDTDEYPSCQEISNRCVSMLAALFNSPAVDAMGNGDAVGAPTVGSSEAIMLCALSMKKRWQERRASLGLDNTKPNLVMGNQTHVCWEKFCRYWDVEARYVKCEEGRYCATPELIASLCDENTIGVVSVFGSTYTGEFEDTKALDAMVTKLNKANGWELVIHVDGASGAMVAPFLYPQLKFDFRLPNVASINISGHKYGLVYPGLGWALWRDAKALPESMVFYCDYLGTVERSITLNFSRGASNVISQYYQLLRLGKEGYTKIMTNLNAISKHVRKAIEATGHFEILSQDVGVPLVAFRLNKVKGSDGKMHNRLYDEFQLADRMRMFGWVLPAYKMPEGAEHVKLMRITIREDFSMTMAERVISKLIECIEWLDNHFTISKEQLESTLGRSVSRMDSNIIVAVEDLIRPC